MAYDTPTGGTGAISHINRTLCTVCQCKGFSNDDSVTGILEILDNGRRYVPRKCRHELELIEAGIPEWVHERARTRIARAGGIVDGATAENAVPAVAQYLPAAMEGMVQVGNEWRIVRPDGKPSAMDTMESMAEAVPIPTSFADAVAIPVPTEVTPENTAVEVPALTDNQSRVVAFVAGHEQTFDGEGNPL